jgi:hypothetical protein
MTTKEPDESMAEVAIASVEAVFDWKKYLIPSATKWTRAGCRMKSLRSLRIRNDDLS